MAFEWNSDAANAPVQNNDYSALPPGIYRAIIADVQDKQTKAGTGAYLNIEFQIHGGRYDGRKVWEICNYANPNETAVRIGFQTLKAIGAALGLPEKFQPSDMLDKMVLIDLIIDKKDEKRNKVKGYKPDSYSAPVAGGTNVTPSGSDTDGGDLPF